MVVSLYAGVGKTTLIRLLGSDAFSDCSGQSIQIMKTKDYVLVEVPSLRSLALEEKVNVRCLNELRILLKVNLVICVGTESCFCTGKHIVEQFLRDCFGPKAEEVGRLAIVNKIPCEEKKALPQQTEVRGWGMPIGIRAINDSDPNEVQKALDQDLDILFLRENLLSFVRSVRAFVPSVREQNKKEEASQGSCIIL